MRAGYLDEEIDSEILCEPIRKLTPEEWETLWDLFLVIEEAWELDKPPKGLNRPSYFLRSRWIDLVKSRAASDPSYLPEYINAAEVINSVFDDSPSREKAIQKLFFETICVDQKDATTRLLHAKYFVINEFITCLVSLGAFRILADGSAPSSPRNYNGYMGGSRFREWTPVR